MSRFIRNGFMHPMPQSRRGLSNRKRHHVTNDSALYGVPKRGGERRDAEEKGEETEEEKVPETKSVGRRII